MALIHSALWSFLLMLEAANLLTGSTVAQSLSPQVLSAVNFKFTEEQNPGIFVGNVGLDSKLATTLTESEFSRLKFELSDSKYFKIDDKSGVMNSAIKIDREEVCDPQPVCTLTAEIIVYNRLDGENYDILKVIAVNVQILDINDNSPKFPADTVSLSIPESINPNEALSASGAVDKDTGENSVQQYSFKDPTDTFKLSVHRNPDGSSYLGVVVKNKLDREVRDFYQVTVVATDGGSPQRSGSVLINITVSDMNDNTPEFQQSSYNESVQENVPLKTPIMRVQASDKDTGKNAEISYQFSARVTNKVRQKFSVDEHTGEISALSTVDFEEDKLFQFIIEAVDHGIPPLSARTNVNLHVIDRNDNSPQININLPPMGTEVSENEPVGKFIAQVLALDADSGNNGLVTCSMDDQHFSLEKFNDNASNMYKVVLAKPLDYEQTTSLRVSLTCKDSGTPPLSNTTTFVVNVLDINDNRPVFTESTYYATNMENLDGAKKVLDVVAHDWDSGDFGKVTYSLEDKYDGLFSINPTTGAVNVLRSLDREHVPKYDFYVIARDNGPERLSSSAYVVITVDDENDEPPRFLKPVYFGDVLENQPAGTLVGNASATDPDTPANSKMSYSILQQGTDYSNFFIDPSTGAIKSTTTFDREEKDQYHFMIRVVDPTNSQFFSTCNFTVRILDDNDHAPIIHLPVEENSTLIMQYSAPVGYIIATIFAYDGDEASSQDSQLTFLIQEGDPLQLFNLNRFTGSLSLARMVTSRDIRTHSLLILVQDGGNPPRFDTKHLNIKINGTIPPVNEGGLSQNIVIVIVMVGVTVVLALVILSTILIIRKIDRQLRRNRASQKNDEDKMYQLKQQDIFTNLSIDNPDDTNPNNLNKKGRKEVSFSLDEETDSHNTSNGSSQPLTSFKGGVDRNEMTKLSRPSSAQLSNGLMNILVHSDKQSTYRRPPRDEKHEGVKKPHEDAVSQSSEETDPSDSGRGGSEDDSSHRGSGVDPEHGSNKFIAQLYHRGAHAPTETKNRHQLNHQQRLSLHPPKSTRAPPSSKEASFRPSVPSQRSPHSSVTSDFESDFSGDRASQSRSDMERPLPASNHNHSSSNSGRATNQVLPFRPCDSNQSVSRVQDWPTRMTSPYSNYNSNNASLMRSFHGQPSNHFTAAPPLTSLSSERLAPSSSDRSHGPSPDRSYKYPSSLRTNTQSTLSEDDRTTLSGSYIVNAEDMRQAIDSMIVRDSVV